MRHLLLLLALACNPGLELDQPPSPEGTYALVWECSKNCFVDFPLRYRQRAVFGVSSLRFDRQRQPVESDFQGWYELDEEGRGIFAVAMGPSLVEGTLRRLGTRVEGIISFGGYPGSVDVQRMWSFTGVGVPE